MTSKSGSLVRFFLFALLLTAAQARLGETDAELIKRFGAPTSVSKHSIIAQSKFIELGPTYSFRQDDWSISCDLIEGRCVRISYAKPGDWSEDQIQLVLNSNGQGAKWNENSKASIAMLQRTWRRIDGSTATWSKGGGMYLVWDAYNKAKAKAEEQAKVAAKKKPKI